MNTCIRVLEARHTLQFGKHKELKTDAYDSFLGASFEWACDDCLRTKKAILANPGAQETAFDPHLAYADTQLKCSECETSFRFTKEEKQVWYENYKLPIHAEPGNCLDCRRKIKQHKADNKTVSEILRKTESELSQEEIETLLEIYAAWDKPEKVKYFEAVLNKRIRQKD